jgi:ribonuclease Z
MRRLFEPRLVNDPFGDPALYVDLRDERRALLFDLGDVSRLPPRLMLRISHVFVSHTHMDHFAGFDGLLRVVLGRKERLVFFGGPGARACFSSRRGFEREGDEPFIVRDDVLHDEPLLRVRACTVDHEMPCLAFALEEMPHPRVDKVRLAALGLATGGWLRDLRLAVQTGAPRDTPIRLHWRDRFGEHDSTRSVDELATALLDLAPGLRIGYLTDLRFSMANRQVLAGLLAGVDQLFIESVFLTAEAAHAARKNHLTARQAGLIARELGARHVVPFHISPRYAGRKAELRAAWSGAA